MQKPRISIKNLKRIDLPDGSYVIVKGSIDYALFEIQEKFAGDGKKSNAEQIKFALDFLKAVITDWNFVDHKGEPIPYAPELLDSLDITSFEDMLPPIMELYAPEKKSLKQSAQQ